MYKIKNGKRVKCTAAQKTKREAEELASTPTAAKRGYDNAVAKAERSKLGNKDKIAILEEAQKFIIADDLTEIEVTDGENIISLTKAKVNSRLKTLYKQGYQIHLTMIAEIRAAKES